MSLAVPPTHHHLMLRVGTSLPKTFTTPSFACAPSKVVVPSMPRSRVEPSRPRTLFARIAQAIAKPAFAALLGASLFAGSPAVAAVQMASTPVTVRDSVPTRTPADVRKEADAIFLTQKNYPDTLGFRIVLADPIDVNHITPRVDSLSTIAVQKNLALETSALTSFSPERADQYRKLVDSIAERPSTRLGLQLLLLEGTLSKGPNFEGRDLLAELHALTTTPLAQGIDRRVLIGELVRELASPISISQQNRGTCTVTALQICVAIEDPAEYVRIMKGLADPEGKVTLRFGELSRHVSGFAPDGSGRSMPSRLFQPAAMELGNGTSTYDNKLDKHLPSGVSGLGVDQLGVVARAIYGERFRTIAGAQPLKHLQDLVTLRGRALGSMNYGTLQNPGNHMVLITGVDSSGISLINPWGSAEKITHQEFASRRGDFLARWDDVTPKGIRVLSVNGTH